MRILNFLQARLQRRLMFYILMIGIIPIFIVSYALVVPWSNDLEENILAFEENRVTQQTTALSEFLADLEEDIVFLANSASTQDIAEALGSGNPLPINLATNNLQRDFLAFSNAKGLYDQIRFLDAAGQEVVRVDYDGEQAYTVTGAALQNKAGNPYFDQTAMLPMGGIYVSELNLNKEQGQIEILADGSAVPVLRYAAPIYVDEALAGVVVTNVFAQNLVDILIAELDAEELTNTIVYLVNEDGYYLYNSANRALEFGFEATEEMGGTSGITIRNDPFFADDEANIDQIVRVGDEVEHLTTENNYIMHYNRVKPENADYHWVLVSARDREILNELEQNLITQGIPSLAFMIVILLVVAGFISRQISKPLVSLSEQAGQIAEGNLSAPVGPLANRADEIGDLARSFTTMADRLQTTLSEQEGRIISRTRDLQTVTDVNAQISTILEIQRLLQDVADLTKERFGLYHSHIYMLDDAGNTLVLTAGAGHVGRQMVSEHRTIAMTNRQSIVAQAAQSRKSIIVDDVTASPTFLPHPLLPDTKSELAAPLVSRGQLLGVLDVQSDQVNNFTPEVLSVLELMAGQIATALNNARLFEVADRTSRHETALSQIDAKLQTATGIDDLLQTTVRELGKALRVPHTAIELHISTNSENQD